MFQIETISAKMLDYYVERSDAVIIDLRDPVSYKKGHVRNAVNIPYHELEEYLEKKQDQRYQFPKDKILILYCDRGGASMQAARSLARAGCRTRSVIGGFAAYRGRNLVSGYNRVIDQRKREIAGRHRNGITVRSVTSIEGDYECMTGNGLCLYFKGNHDNVKNRNKNDTNHKEKRL